MDDDFFYGVIVKSYRVVYYQFDNGHLTKIVQRDEMGYWEARKFLKSIRKITPYDKDQYQIEKYYY